MVLSNSSIKSTFLFTICLRKYILFKEKFLEKAGFQSIWINLLNHETWFITQKGTVGFTMKQCWVIYPLLKPHWNFETICSLKVESYLYSPFFKNLKDNWKYANSAIIFFATTKTFLKTRVMLTCLKGNRSTEGNLQVIIVKYNCRI